jgi:hypothetical protein
MPREALRYMRIAVFLFATSLALRADWKIYIDKKASQITGLRNAHAEIKAKGLSTAVLLLGCTDGKPILRFADQYRGFNVKGTDGAYHGHVKIRPSAATEYIDAEVPAGHEGGITFLVIDDKLADLLPKMKADTLLFAQLPYEGEDKIVQFPLVGLDGALTKMADAGCRP